MPPHKNRRPQADLLTGRTCRQHCGRDGATPAVITPHCLTAPAPWPAPDTAPDDNAGPGREAEAGGGGNEQGA
ncbi:hypothetical protein QE94_004429 [Salmonella enterica subsp. enterica]|nr:hypothetical protein [Salmonella enterica subsp. enterica]